MKRFATEKIRIGIFTQMNTTMIRNRVSIGILAALFVVAGFVANSNAMPNFARKYSLPCSGCHTVVPRLNETGYNFRAAGFRMPDEIGKPVPTFNLGDYIAGRTSVTLSNLNTTPATGASVSTTSYTSG